MMGNTRRKCVLLIVQVEMAMSKWSFSVTTHKSDASFRNLWRKRWWKFQSLKRDIGNFKKSWPLISEVIYWQWTFPRIFQTANRCVYPFWDYVGHY
jgi:hypothetical protein